MADTTNPRTDGYSVLPFELSDKELLHFNCCIDGEWIPSRGGARFDIIDPGSGKTWASCPDCTVDDVDQAVQSSYQAFLSYSTFAPRKRAQLLLAWHQLIVASRDDLAKILVYETGKPLAEAYGEIDYATTFSWWFVGEADRIQGTTSASAVPGRRALVIKQPIGVAAALVPWNFPVALVLRKASAALAAGCTMVVKTSPETPLTALCLAELAIRAGLPPGAFNVLTTSLENTPAVAEALCLHPLIKKVTFTGSTSVGKIVARLCAQNLKKTTLELGGNCPFIVFDDANFELAVEQLMALKWRHAGQACVTANRVYVQRGIHNKFIDEIVKRTRLLKMGHGMEKDITLGPLTTSRGLDRAELLAKDAVKKGAIVVLGTGLREGRGVTASGLGGHSGGFFMAPTVLTGVTDEMSVNQEEVFAPILGISVFETEDEVVKRANNTALGLASYVFTKDADRLWRLFEKLEAGMIGLNSGNSSAAEAPFGGIKDSGYGKESGKDVAINEFLITKTGTLTIEDHY